MGAYQILKGFFVPKPGLRAPMSDPFVTIDREVAAREMALKERGAEQGALEQPPTESIGFDGVESEIVGKVADALNTAQIDAHTQLRVYETRLSELALLDNVSSIETSSRKAISDFKDHVIGVRDRLTNAREQIFHSFAEIAEFRQEHGLRRAPHPPKHQLLGWAFIITAWLVESILNAFFLRVNDNLGLLGGVTAAAALAAVNVGLSVAAGHVAWRYLFHRRVAACVLAWLGTAVWFCFLIGWNLVAGHYRDAKSVGIESPEAYALTSFFANPFGLDTLYSWGLFIAGMAFATSAAAARFNMSDPYGGYGALAARHEDRCNAYLAEVESVRADMKHGRDDAIADAEEVREQLGIQFRERSTVLAARQALLQRFDEWQDSLEAIGRELLAIYRTANRQARQTPAPAYFDQAWVMKRTKLEVTAAVPWLEDELRHVEASLAQSISTIADAFDEASQSIETLDQLRTQFTSGQA